jgi:aspartyl-tRNA(Asn)/glutamyl-tRNA(Gln) amidotransferase subunit B
MGDYFEQVARQSNDAKTAANWMLGEVFAALKSTGQSIEHFTVRPADLAALLNMVRDGVVSHSAAKQVFGKMVMSGDRPSAIAEREGLLKVSDDAALAKWIDEVFAEHPAEVERFVGGEKRLQGVLVGYVMKQSKGTADPKRVNQLLAERVAT